MIPKKIQEISFEDIYYLFDSEVRENKTLEYKSQLPHEGESSKIPFLAEVCALANTEGGDIIFGIKDEKGTPIELLGLEIDNIDKEILRLENSILTGIEPRVQNISSKVVCQKEKNFIVLRIPKSWNAPHRVNFKDHGKFYKRNSAGKYPMDVSDLRIAFIQAEHTVDKIRNFKSTRIGKLKTEYELPVKLYSSAKIVLHLMPLSGFVESNYLYFDEHSDITLKLSPLGSSGWNHRYNLDGFVTYSGSQNNHSTGYTQIFRNGVIEAVSTLGWPNEKKYIASQAYEHDLIKGTLSYLKVFRDLEIEPPIYFFISLLGIKEYSFATSNRISWHTDGHELDRDDLLLPDGIITNLNENPHKFFQPFFDMVWNAYGYKKSFNYDQEGNWNGQ